MGRVITDVGMHQLLIASKYPIRRSLNFLDFNTIKCFKGKFFQYIDQEHYMVIVIVLQKTFTHNNYDTTNPKHS